MHGENVDNSFDRLRGILGVKRTKDQVAGLGGGEGGCHRLEVTHLTHENHIRILTKGVA